MFEYSAPDSANEDGLFLERLETFMDKCLADIKAFSERELRPFEETRRSIAEWHAKYLFQASGSYAQVADPLAARRQHVRSTLIDTSRVLETLARTSGVQSFFLAVDPQDNLDEGFLGGSICGREFWRNLRGGGTHGAKAFKVYSLRTDSSLHSQVASPQESSTPSTLTPPSGTKKESARVIKTELYDTVRSALRAVSGIRTAEMKWSNPERLDMYGVRLVGWPQDIPSQNPSTLKLNHNKQLLDSFKNGSIKFEKMLPGGSSEDPPPEPEAEEDFSWALDPNAGGTPEPEVAPQRSSSALSVGNRPRQVDDTPPSQHASPSTNWQTQPLTRETTPNYATLEDFGSSGVTYGYEYNHSNWYDQPRCRKRRREGNASDDDAKREMDGDDGLLEMDDLGAESRSQAP